MKLGERKNVTPCESAIILYNEVNLMNSFELTTLVTTMANIISRRLSPAEIALVAGLFVGLGDTLATIAAKQSLYEEREEKQSNGYSVKNYHNFTL